MGPDDKNRYSKGFEFYHVGSRNNGLLVKCGISSTPLEIILYISKGMKSLNSKGQRRQREWKTTFKTHKAIFGRCQVIGQQEKPPQ